MRNKTLGQTHTYTHTETHEHTHTRIEISATICALCLREMKN